MFVNNPRQFITRPKWDSNSQPHPFPSLVVNLPGLSPRWLDWPYLIVAYHIAIPLILHPNSLFCWPFSFNFSHPLWSLFPSTNTLPPHVLQPLNVLVAVNFTKVRRKIKVTCPWIVNCLLHSTLPIRSDSISVLKNRFGLCFSSSTDCLRVCLSVCLPLSEFNIATEKHEWTCCVFYLMGIFLCPFAELNIHSFDGMSALGYQSLIWITIVWETRTNLKNWLRERRLFAALTHARTLNKHVRCKTREGNPPPNEWVNTW